MAPQKDRVDISRMISGHRIEIRRAYQPDDWAGVTVYASNDGQLVFQGAVPEDELMLEIPAAIERANAYRAACRAREAQR